MRSSYEVPLKINFAWGDSGQKMMEFIITKCISQRDKYSALKEKVKH